MKIIEAHQTIKKQLKNHGFENYESESRYFLEHFLGSNWAEILCQQDQSLSEGQKKKLEILLERRLAQEPLAYIFNEKYFFKTSFYVDARVLIPRPETELIVERYLDIKMNAKTIVDLGTGSGCLGLSLLKEEPYAKGFLVDVSADALEVARKNTESLRLESRVELVQEDAKEWRPLELKGKVDFISANPPYIDWEASDGGEGALYIQKSVRDYEPEVALFSHEKGLADIFSWFKTTEYLLRPGGRAIFEFGDGQREKIDLFLQQESLFSSWEFYSDYADLDRGIELQK